MRKEYKVIDSVVSDNADYEWMTENGIHNTLKPYWQWADETGAHVEFEVRYPHSKTWGVSLQVFALFKNDADYRDFIAQHVWNLPKTKLLCEKMDEALFVE